MKFKCDNCGGPLGPIFMVRNQLWEISKLKGWCCIKCFGKAFGRPLMIQDLKPDVPCNLELIDRMKRLSPVQSKFNALIQKNGRLIGTTVGSVCWSFRWENGSADPVPRWGTVRALINKELLYPVPASYWGVIGESLFSPNIDDWTAPSRFIYRSRTERGKKEWIPMDQIEYTNERGFFLKTGEDLY